MTRDWYFLVGKEETLLEEEDSSLERALDSDEATLCSLDALLELDEETLCSLVALLTLEEIRLPWLEEGKAEETFPPQEIKKSNNAGEKRIERFINLILIYLYIGGLIIQK